ncbi:MAG: hypothetical protein IK107_05280 [Oscillospiraceae bacterium]|nr:hypothetical protein [Oscillospiraceae bacterium]
MDALELSEQIKTLADTLAQLENADRLSIDLYACTPTELHRFLRAAWVSSDGKNREIDFCADGGTVSAHLADAAAAERDRLNRAIIDQIRALADAVSTAPATELHPCRADQSEHGTAARSGRNGGQNDRSRIEWGSD